MDSLLDWEFNPESLPPTSPAAHVFNDINALSEVIQEFRRLRLHPAGILLAAALDGLRRIHGDIALGTMVDSDIAALLDTRSKVIVQFIQLLRQDGFGLEPIIQARIEELRTDATRP